MNSPSCPYCSSAQARRITSDRHVRQDYDYKTVTLSQIYYCESCNDLYQRCVTTTDRATPLPRATAKQIASSHGLKFAMGAEEKSEPSTHKSTDRTSTRPATTSSVRHKTTPEEFWEQARHLGLA